MINRDKFFENNNINNNIKDKINLNQIFLIVFDDEV